MDLIVERRFCQGAGICVMTAPEVFDQDDEQGLVQLIDGVDPNEHESDVREAVELCPARAIRLKSEARP